MFGPSLLICAVTEPMYYGPESTELDREKNMGMLSPGRYDWYDYWTNKKYEGGQYVTVDAPIDRMPIFVKAGSILPVAEGLAYASQKPEEPVKLMVYPGSRLQSLLFMRMREITIILRRVHTQPQN